MTWSSDVERELQSIVDAEASIEGATCLLRVGVPEHDMVSSHVAGRVSADGEPATSATPFRIASITKTFTAVVITQLAAEGRLRFDDRMIDHLPATVLDLVPRLHVLDGVTHGERITVRQLLRHAAGLFDYAMSTGFFSVIAADPGKVWTPREMLEGSIEWGEPHFVPGGGYGYAYSDTGYVLLGLIIEHLDGRPLHSAYRERILRPLGLDHTYLEGHEEHRGAPLSHPYQGTIDVFPIHGTADWAGGGLVSTTDDLAAFAAALVAGRLVQGEWLEEMYEWRFRTLDPSRHSPGFLGYGFGLEARDVHGVLFRGHRGHWGAWMHVDPVSGVTFTGTVNQADRPPHEVVQSTVAALQRAGLLVVHR